MNKFNLQIVTGLLGIVPLATGLLGMMGVNNPEYLAAGVPPIVLLDTNLRFYSGVWVGVGLALWWLIPTIERQTVLFRVLWGMIFIGGIGRLLFDDYAGTAARRLRRIYGDRNRRCAALHLVAVPCGETRTETCR
jgi:Domain of unknown function (DUF4345)